MFRPIAALAALALGTAALAQTNASQQVQLLAPQLVVFSGSSGNFESLVTGLTSGTPVTLASAGADGSLQLVTFVPGTALPVLDTARLLETARQNLIARGIATPNGQQLAASLLGGTVSTLSGTSAITGVLSGATTSPVPVQVRTETSPPLTGLGTPNLSPAQLQAVRDTVATGTGARLSEAEVSQALQAAAALLAQQGILNPTAEQLRAALFGGGLVIANGTSVLVQGVLQGRVRNTSDSPDVRTSASPAGSTSASPLSSTSNSAPFGAAPAAGGASSAAAGVAPRGRLPSGAIRPGAR